MWCWSFWQASRFPPGFIGEIGIPAEVAERKGGSNSVVESQPSKLLVAGSIPVSRSKESGNCEIG